MYDVVYLERNGSRRLLGADLDRETAAELARSEARRRHVGRMFLTGSDLPCGACMVLIVESSRRPVSAGV